LNRPQAAALRNLRDSGRTRQRTPARRTNTTAVNSIFLDPDDWPIHSAGRSSSADAGPAFAAGSYARISMVNGGGIFRPAPFPKLEIDSASFRE